MTPAEPGDGDSSFKRECKESTLQKMRTMCQLSGATGGDGVPLASLVPVANVITSIVSKNRAAFDRACLEMRAHIQQKHRAVSLQNLAAIAEINFLEGFETFISCIYLGNARRAAEDEEPSNTQSSNTSSIHGTTVNNSPVRRRSSKRTQEEIRDEISVVPVKKLAVARRSFVYVEKHLITPKQEVQPITVASAPTRKSTRLSIEDAAQFGCVFAGCSEEFKTVYLLTLHAERCAHKEGQVLSFRCSVCKRSFNTDKGIKSHKGSRQNMKCADGSIELEAVRVEPAVNSVVVAAAAA
ncbi:hypothetical protein PFISCL1PPCAC_22494, partial [Pristionchus fissidentatus]